MTRYIQSDHNQYIAPSSSTTLHTGAGKVRALLVTGLSTTPGLLTVYDNTAASGNVLIAIDVSAYSPVTIILPPDTPLVFSTGLHAVTDALTRAFLLTEV